MYGGTTHPLSHVKITHCQRLSLATSERKADFLPKEEEQAAKTLAMRILC